MVSGAIEGCNFLYRDIIGATEAPFRPSRAWIIHRRIGLYGFLVTKRISPVLLSVRSFLRGSGNNHHDPEEHLHLEPGDWVEVRSEAEIFSTLDGRGKYQGLGFMPEMVKFCGKRMKVVKKVDRIALESTGEMRRLRSPTVFLEGVFCDGSYHYDCDRSCYCFWREAWLRKVEDGNR